MTATNEMLSNSDIRYNYLIGSIPDVIGELDLDGTISLISPQAYDMLGYHPDEMIGTNLITFIHPDDVPGIMKAMKKAIKSKEVILSSLRLKHKKGNYILVFAKGKLIKLDDKARLIGFIRDITELNETEKKLEESQDIFEQLNEVFLKFKEDPIFNVQLLINTAGLLLKADCGLFNITKRVNGKEVLESLVIYNEPPNFTRESDPKGHICTDIIKDNPDEVVILSNLDKTDYIKTDENVRKYNLKQYVGYVVRFNNKPLATFCVVYTENREMSKNEIFILKIMSKSASTELRRWYSRIDLQESEKKYRSLVEGLNEALYRISLPDGNYTYLSPAIKYVTGYSSKDFLDNSMLIKKIMHPDFIDYFKEKWADLLKGKVPQTYEYKIIDPDNKERWITQSNKRIFDRDGNFIAIEGLCRNITERKEVEQKLKESEDKYKNLFEKSPFAIVLINLDGRIEDCNAQTENLFGYKNEEIVGKDFLKFNIFSHDGLPKLARSFKKFIKTGVPEPSEIQIYKKNGTLAWISTYPIAIKIARSSYILVTIQDITQHKKSEEQIRYQAKLIESVSDAIISTDIDFNILSWNKAAENMYSWSAEEVIGKNISETIRVEYPYDEEKTVLKTFFREGFWQGEVIQPKKDKSKIQVYSSVKLLKDSIGNPIGAVAINRDISDLKKTEDKLRESEEKFRNITEQNLMGIGILQDNTIKYINKAMADIYGYSLEEVLNWKPMEFFKIFAPDTLEIAKEQGLKKQTGDTTQLVHYIVHGIKKTGELIWVDNFSRSITYEGRPADLVSQIDITEKVGAEQKLKESEEKYRYFFDNAQVGLFWSRNTDGKFIECNDTFARLVGYNTREECLADYIAIEHYVNLKDRDEMLEKIKLNGDIKNYEIQVSKRDSTAYWANIYARINLKENRIEGAATDITERKNMEIKLKESEAKWRSITENSPDYIMTMDKDEKITFINYTVPDLTVDEVIGKSVYDFVQEEFKESVRKHFKDVIEIGKPHRFGMGYVDKEGNQFYFDVHCGPIWEEDKIIGIINRSTDITEHKKKEEKIRLQSEIMTNMSEGVYLIRLEDFTIVYANPRFEEMFGYDPGEMIDKNAAIVNAPTDKTPEETKNEIVGILKDSGEWHGEVLNIKKDGTPFWCYANVSLFDHPEYGRVIVSIHTNITEKKEGEEERNRFFNLPLHILLVLGFDGIIQRINPGWKDILGYDETDLVGNNFIGILHPDDWEAANIEIEKLSQGSVTKHIENHYRSKDGSYRTLVWSAVANLDKKAIYAIAYDVTEQRRIEREMIESEKKIKDLIEALPIGITISNPKGELFEANSYSIKMFGFDSKEEFLKTPAINLFADPANRLQYIQLLNNGPVREFETKFKQKNGKLFWGSLTSIAKAVGGDVIIFNTIQDISQRKIDEE
ncbi:MAG TPA: PAS domain S-box protein, partial [Candidatus Nanopelagicaceae bacterium]|nr:PAS domain S-box protein [Candidatus Nanopelagicaceae bacterium]